MDDDPNTEADFGHAMWQSLERQEAAVKASIVSVGEVEAALKATVEALEAAPTEDPDVREAVADLGRSVERHEDDLEDVIRRLNDHKGVIRRADDVGDRELAGAMEHARRKARQEVGPARPPGSDGGPGR